MAVLYATSFLRFATSSLSSTNIETILFVKANGNISCDLCSSSIRFILDFMAGGVNESSGVSICTLTGFDGVSCMDVPEGNIFGVTRAGVNNLTFLEIGLDSSTKNSVSLCSSGYKTALHIK